MLATGEDNKPASQLLAMVVEDLQNPQYYKYLLASSGLVADSQSQQPHLAVKELMRPENAQLCLQCGYMWMSLFDKKLRMHKSGCQEAPFPTTTAPASPIT